MDCPSIHNLKFDHYGKTALQDIRDVYDFSKVLGPVLVAGTMLDIFFKSSRFEVVYDFSTEDFSTLREALKKVPEVVRAKVSDYATLAALVSPNREQELFFRALAGGCKLQ